MKNVYIILLALIVISACSPKNSDSDKLQVVATTGMIADVAKNIGGDAVEVTGLMGPGVDPHLYKATAKDLQRLAEADVILYNGLHLESKMAEVFEKMGGRTVTAAVAEKIPVNKLIHESSNVHDPHVWFDLELWILVTEEIYSVLKSASPENEAVFSKNYAEYQSRLSALKSEVESKIATVPSEKRILITAHDAFNYFGKAYGFEVMGLQGISTVSEAGTQDVQKLAELIAEKKIPAIFVESSVPKKNIEALQAAVKSRGYEVKIGGELFSDAMGDEGTVEGTYIGMVEHNVNTIVNSLKE
jgi:manganese/zinc/iron transport system substrate-binding protein